ncbi:cache domain-containing sensor histidine kinase [Paenibacillus roseipurpureus]|uniref:Sensor histidine kinase n=1 Tax=Paenibacillus roseopurpureus TaxID=2918901 RepID=A0AA96LKH3_9BACL|nr:sensor histidine kinase [Paenibacillus sp. MBLB1832]WNR42762.1 sensor histidine kinase [Paenibacillus sp. MBLB1832]
MELLKKAQIGIHQQMIAALQNIMDNRSKTIRDILLKIYNDQDLNTYIMSMMDDTEPGEFYADNTFDKQTIVNKLDDLVSVDKNISHLILYNNTTKKAYLYLYDLNYTFSDFTKPIIKNIPQLQKPTQESFIIPAHLDPYYALQSSKYKFGIASNFYYPRSSLFLGRFIIEFGIEDLQNTVLQFGKDMQGYLLILTKEGDVIFDSSSTYYGKKYPYFDKIGQSSDSVQLAEDSIVNVVNSDQSKFIYASVLPKSTLSKQLSIFNNSTYLAAIILLLFIFSVYFFVTGIISKRVNRIVNAMGKTVKSNLLHRIPLTHKDNEFEQIAIHFNKMCDNLQDYINKSYVYELQQKVAEMKILENQINPHFLYNSLEAIRARLEIDGNDEGGQMIYSLATLFRASLKADSVVTIAEEIEFCHMYLNIFEVRYQNLFQFHIDIQDNIKHCGIIKLILQPIVENYLIHGFDRRRQDNVLSIRGYQEGNTICITVSDNGIGIPFDKLNELKRKLNTASPSTIGSIGLHNANERIKLLFGSSYGLDIESDGSNGSNVTLRIPCLRPEEIKEQNITMLKNLPSNH